MNRFTGHTAVRQLLRSGGWKVRAVQQELLRTAGSTCSALLVVPPEADAVAALLAAVVVGHADAPGATTLWITSTRTQADELRERMLQTAFAVGMNWAVDIVTGGSGRRKQRGHRPQVALVTPESLHAAMAVPGSVSLLRDTGLVVVDDWRRLFRTKRGVLTELALARIARLQPDVRIWASAASNTSEEAFRAVVTLQRHTAVVVPSGRRRPAFAAESAAPSPPVPVDMLMQYCCTRACSDGFTADELFAEITSTAAFASLPRRDFEWALDILTTGGSIHAREHRRLRLADGRYSIADPAVALRHRMQIATERPEMMQLGNEGRSAAVAMPGEPLVSEEQEFLVEYLSVNGEGHLFLYLCEGTAIHKILAAVLAHRLARVRPVELVAVNDYGIHLRTDGDLQPERLPWGDLFTGYNLSDDLRTAVDLSIPARRCFAGIISRACSVSDETGEWGEEQETRGVYDELFDTLTLREPGNLLLKQAHEEALYRCEYGVCRALRRLEELEPVVIRRNPSSHPVALAGPDARSNAATPAVTKGGSRTGQHRRL